MPLVADVGSFLFLEGQTFGAMPLVSDGVSLSFLERQGSGAMPLVSDVGSLQFLERKASGASHWFPMSVHFLFLSDIPLVLITGYRCRFTFVS